MRSSTRDLAGMGLITAVTVILQFMGSFIHVGVFSISLTLIPIVVGASLYGVGAGAWLGLVFGVVVLISGDAGPFIAINAPGAVLIVLLKGILAGSGAGAAYNALARHSPNVYIPVVVAAIACPVINTGIFLIGCRLFFYDTIITWASAAGFESVALYFLVGLVGANFFIELIINMVLSPIIVRIINIGKKTA